MKRELVSDIDRLRLAIDNWGLALVNEMQLLREAIVAINIDRKTEPQTDYPCDTCANKGDHDGECRNCVSDSEVIKWKKPSHYKPKDEPQCEACINYGVEFTDDDSFDTCLANECHYEPKDEPQTETQTETQNSNLTFEKRTMRDCYNCKRYETEEECVECHYEPKDEPQAGREGE